MKATAWVNEFWVKASDADAHSFARFAMTPVRVRLEPSLDLHTVEDLGPDGIQVDLLPGSLGGYVAVDPLEITAGDHEVVRRTIALTKD
jgi:hypothetical protein